MSQPKVDLTVDEQAKLQQERRKMRVEATNRWHQKHPERRQALQKQSGERRTSFRRAMKASTRYFVKHTSKFVWVSDAPDYEGESLRIVMPDTLTRDAALERARNVCRLLNGDQT